MTFKLSITGDKELGEFAVRLRAATKLAQSKVEMNAPIMAEAASNIILEAIESDLAGSKSFGAFMAPRTKIDVTYSGASIILNVSGMTEGEAGHPPRYDGSEVRAKDSDNLWALHEFGSTSEGHTSSLTFNKDVGGVTVHRKGKAHGAGSPYKGAVRSLIRGLTPQLNEVLRGLGGMVAGSVAGQTIELASGGKIQMARGARAAMRAAGVDESILASLGVSKVSITSSGQINLMGRTAMGGHTFISGKSAGIPTTINR